MDIVKAIRYPFDDPNWPVKLAMTGLITFGMIVFMPFLFLGLVPMAALLGYSLDIINHVRDRERIILPEWGNIGDYLSRGAAMMPALILYNLPLLLMSCCLWVVRASIGDDLIEGMATFTVICCLVPFTLIYIGISWPMLAAATARYARGSSAGVYFDLLRIYETVTSTGSFSVQWFLASMLVNVVLLVIQFIPFIGQTVLCVLLVPIQAHLLGQYARVVDRAEPHRSRH